MVPEVLQVLKVLLENLVKMVFAVLLVKLAHLGATVSVLVSFKVVLVNAVPLVNRVPAVLQDVMVFVVNLVRKVFVVILVWSATLVPTVLLDPLEFAVLKVNQAHMVLMAKRATKAHLVKKVLKAILENLEMEFVVPLVTLVTQVLLALKVPVVRRV